MPGHHHRAGALHQTNKKNKRSKASKRSRVKAAGGKVNSAKNGAATIASQNKADRRNIAAQKRDHKKQELIRKKRGLDGSPAPPRVIGIVSLGSGNEIEERTRSFIIEGADSIVRPHSNHDATISCNFHAHKKDGKMTVLTSRSAFTHYSADEDGAIMAALDLARICDVLLFVIDGNASQIEGNFLEIQFGGDEQSTSTKSTRRNWDHLITRQGDRILNAIKAQGLPTTLTLLAHTEKDALELDHLTMASVKSLRRSSVKRRLELKNFVNRFASTEFGTGNDKVIEVDLTSMDKDEVCDEIDKESAEMGQLAAAAFVRTLCNMTCSPPNWVSKSPRTYILSDEHRYIETSRELSISGYIRGIAPLDINLLVHVPNLGTFACKSVKKTIAPLAQQRHNSDMETKENILFSEPENRESLERLATPDALQGEQNLIGFDGDDDFDQEHDGKDDAFARPSGWSDYQSAWLDAIDEDVFDGTEDHGELAAELNHKSPIADAMFVPTNGMDLDDDNDVTNEERQALIEQRRKARKEELEFPDEVQLDEGVNARDRFARYRSLKSFRKSYWDPKESLPGSYASIYHFSNFRTTQRMIMNDMKDVVRATNAVNGNFFGATANRDASMDDDSEDDDDLLEGCVPSGTYVEITLENVSRDDWLQISPNALLAAVSLLPHENKVSVLHMGLSRTIGCDISEIPIKSKDVLTFRCGWRTWKARPVFSQNNLNCDKHKFERFMPTSFFAASIFGPVTYSPCPVLVFRENENSARELVAVGSVLGADADRIVLKRVILTGYPTRVHKRHATVKYMFYNPDDVKWFRPAGLYTKHGLEGNIVESVGEHGTMKCLFNAPIKQHDTVCLPLYKRVYPKFAPVDGATNQLEVR